MNPDFRSPIVVALALAAISGGVMGLLIGPTIGGWLL